MANDDLKSFKISDKVKPQVEPPRPGQSKEAEAPPPSVGFPRIEAVVEADVPDLTGLASRQAELEGLTGSGSNKDKAAAKKAALAYQRTRELITYLLETKAKMVGGGGSGSSG